MTITLLPDRSMEADNTQILVYADPTRTLQIVTGKQYRSGWGGHGWYRWDDIIYRGVYIGRYHVKRHPGAGCRIETMTCEPHNVENSGSVRGGDWYWLIKCARLRGVKFPLMRGDLVQTGDGTYTGYIYRKSQRNFLGYEVRIGDVEGPTARFAAHTLKLLKTRDEIEVERARAAEGSRAGRWSNEYWG